MESELTKKAMKTNCAICDKPLRPYHLWRYSETRRGSLIFTHYDCLYGGTNEYKNDNKKNN